MKRGRVTKLHHDKLVFGRDEICWSCKGKGKRTWNAKEDCRVCGGRGYITREDMNDTT